MTLRTKRNKRLESVSVKQSTRKRRGAKGVEAWALTAKPYGNYCRIGIWRTRKQAVAYLRDLHTNVDREFQLCRITYTLTRSKED